MLDQNTWSFPSYINSFLNFVHLCQDFNKLGVFLKRKPLLHDEVISIFHIRVFVFGPHKYEELISIMKLPYDDIIVKT
jgi:hypothetical protein